MSLSPHLGCGAYSRAGPVALINFFVPDAALIRVNTVGEIFVSKIMQARDGFKLLKSMRRLKLNRA